MAKRTILEILIIIAFALLIFYMIDPTRLIAIINSIYPIFPTSTTSTTTIPIPTGNITMENINQVGQTLSYTVTGNVVIHLNGQGNSVAVTSVNKSYTVYVEVSGNYDSITLKNCTVVLDVQGDHNLVRLENSLVLSQYIQGAGTQIYNTT